MIIAFHHATVNTVTLDGVNFDCIARNLKYQNPPPLKLCTRQFTAVSPNERLHHVYYIMHNCTVSQKCNYTRNDLKICNFKKGNRDRK